METNVAIDNNSNSVDTQKNDVEDNDSNDDEFEYPKSRLVLANKDCCAKTILTATVVVTAILLVVIVASSRKPNVFEVQPTTADTEDVSWFTNNNKQLVLKHQFLLRGLAAPSPAQILAVDDQRQLYVILWPDVNKHYNLYLIADFQKRTETRLVVSKSQNIFGTDIEENTVLLCQTDRFERGFRGSFVSMSLFMAARRTKAAHSITHIEGPLTLEKYISAVVNSSCENLKNVDLFTWNKPDESLACGDRTHSEAAIESCSQNLYQTSPVTSLTKSQACHKFRSCNYIQRSCDQFYRRNPSKTDNHPYCVCRMEASNEAKSLSCPRVSDDGGECEIPRRDLQVTQSNLPCLCPYRFSIIYPYLPGSASTIFQQGENTNEKQSSMLEWNVREEVITGPAITFSQCPCQMNMSKLEK